jgi:outer membrane lipoprotein-sorting protein
MTAMIILSFFIKPAFADDDQKVIQEVQDYLNSLKTIKADFIQVDQNGILTEGKFYLSRPGEFRWEYNDPIPVLIIASDGWVNYYDTELKQATYVTLGSTPAGILAQENIVLNDVSEVKQSYGIISVKISKEEGGVTLVFQEEPMMLETIIIEDNLDNTTTIMLQNQQRDIKLSDDLFRPLNPLYYNKRDSR